MVERSPIRGAMTRRDAFRWGLAFGVGLSMGVSRANAASPADQLSLAAGSAIDHVTAFAAVDKGIFAKHGVNVKVTLYPTGVEMINALQAGEAHVAQFGTIPLLAAASRGIPLVLIAYNHGDPNSKSYSANQAIIAAAASGIRQGDVVTLAGKKIGLPLGTDAQAYVETLLQARRIPKGRVQITNITPQDTLIAIKQRSVDAVAIWEADASRIVLEVPGSVRVIEGSNPGWFTPGTIVSTRQVIDQRRAQLERLLAAHAESHQWVRQHLDEAAAIASRWVTGLAEPVARVAIRFPILDVRMSKLTYDGFDQITIPWMAANNRLSRAIAAKDLVDPSIIVKVMTNNPGLFNDVKAIAPENRLT